MALHSVSHLSLKVSVLTLKSCLYFYMLLIWSSCYNTSVTGTYQVIGSQDILVKVEDEVILPCHIDPPFNMARKTVEWSRPDLNPAYVYILQNGDYNKDDLNPLYKERTSLFAEKLPNGNMSLKLSRVKLSDEGTYRCSAPQLQQQLHINSFTFIQLLVGSGSHPVISSNGPTDSSLCLTCDSGCWYPQPEMSWLDSNGTLLPAGPSVTEKPSPHCYSVQRNVTVTLPGHVTCRVHLPHINHTVETQYDISERDIPTEGGSTGSVVAGIFTLIIILVAAGLGYLYWKKKHPDEKVTRDAEMPPLVVNPADQPMMYSDVITNDEEIRIVMVGKTGAGKSATGNTILGTEAFKAKNSPRSVTLSCIKASGVVADRKVSIIDTPGLFDTEFSEYETIKEVKNCITCAAPGPHVFLAVISQGRFTEEKRNVVAKIQQEFGQSSDKYTMILFTHGDMLEVSIEDFVKESPELQELISKYSGRYHVFNNKTEDPSQVTELLKKINQMVEENGGSHYTNQMFQEEVRRQGLKTLMDSLNLTAYSDEEKEKFVMQHRLQLIQYVPPSTVMSIVGSLGTRVHPDLYAESKAAETSDQMKTLYTTLLDPGETSVRAAFYNALIQHLSETPDLSPTGADQLQQFLAEKKRSVEYVIEVFEQGAEAASKVGDLFPLFAVAAPIVRLCLHNVESKDAVFMKEQFQKVRDRLNVVSEEIQQVSDEIKKSGVDAQYFSVEENINNQFQEYMDILNAKPKLRKDKKKQFLNHFEKTGGDKNLHVLYNSVTGDNLAGESVLEITLNSVGKSRRVMEDFCFRLKKLFCIGIIALMGHVALIGVDDEVEELLKAWRERMKDVQTKMNTVIEDCIVSFPKQSELDSNRLVGDHSDLTNQQLADAIIEKLKKKYDWVFWSVRVYRSPSGLFSKRREFHCSTGKSCFQVPSSDEKLNIMVSYSASPEPVDRNKIQRLIQGQKSLVSVAELLFAELPGPCVIHTVKTCKDLACSWSFTDELHYWEEFTGTNFYVCAHSA